MQTGPPQNSMTRIFDGFASGHDFSRALQAFSDSGFSPCGTSRRNHIGKSREAAAPTRLAGEIPDLERQSYQRHIAHTISLANP
jgi:hypothetical protein